MIRVLHVVTSLEPGGIETTLMRWYRAIDRDVVQFDFLVHRKEVGLFESEVLGLGGVIHRVPPVTLRGLFKYIRSLWQFFGRHNGYVVHSHVAYLSSLVLGMAELRGVPARVAHSHQASLKSRRRVLAGAVGKALLGVVATHRLACGEMAGRWLYGRRAFEVIPNALDLSAAGFSSAARDDIRRELGIAEDAVVIGHVGGFNHVKNHARIVRVFAQFLQKRPQAQLLLVGDGPLKERITEEIRDMAMDSCVHLTGVRTDVPALLSAMDAFIFPSYSEGLPVALLEAQATGLPCVVSNAVTDEVAVTDLVGFQSLDDGDDQWVAALVRETARKDRRSYVGEIRIAGYDSKDVAAALQMFYVKLAHFTEGQG